MGRCRGRCCGEGGRRRYRVSGAWGGRADAPALRVGLGDESHRAAAAHREHRARQRSAGVRPAAREQLSALGGAKIVEARGEWREARGHARMHCGGLLRAMVVPRVGLRSCAAAAAAGRPRAHSVRRVSVSRHARTEGRASQSSHAARATRWRTREFGGARSACLLLRGGQVQSLASMCAIAKARRIKYGCPSAETALTAVFGASGSSALGRASCRSRSQAHRRSRRSAARLPPRRGGSPSSACDASRAARRPLASIREGGP